MPDSKDVQSPLVTPQAVERTILCDDEAFLWFQKLCSLPEVAKKLCGSGKDASGHYRDYRILSFLAFALGVLFGSLCLAGVLLSGIRSFVFYLSGTAAAAGSLFFFLKRREHMAVLAARFIEMDMLAFPEGVTLYQIGEIYSRKYRVPSLVDLIWLRERWVRNTVVFVYFGLLGVYFFSFWDILFWTAAGCIVILCLFQGMIMLRKAA